MSEHKIETPIGMCIVALTKHIMKRENVGYETAYKKLLATELYKLLQDSETLLFLEKNEYLYEALEAELAQGENGLYKYGCFWSW